MMEYFFIAITLDSTLIWCAVPVGEGPRGILVDVLDYNIKVTKFEFF